MAPDSATQQRMYRAIKHDLFRGGWPLTPRLEIQAIADRHITSTTPVREALHRLIGENLLEHHPEGGIRLVLLSELALRELYEWNAQHLVVITRLGSSAAVKRAIDRIRERAAIADAGSPHWLTEVLFTGLAEATGNQEFIDQTIRCNERLHFVRRIEGEVLSDPERELRRVVNDCRVDYGRILRAQILAYHKRRRENAGPIARQLKHAFSLDTKQ